MPARKFPAAPKLQRKIEVIQPKVQIIIVCEGRNTEPSYVRSCIEYYGAGLVRLHIVPDTGVPLTVVRLAVEEKQKRLAEERRKPVGERCSFSVWAIFDKDEHDVRQALEIASTGRIGIAFSNPCFELWPILHLEDYGSQDGRHALQRRLRDLMPRYDHENGALIDFEQIKENYLVALERSARLNGARREEGCEGGCPSTTVGELVQKIIDNGKIHFRTAR